MLLLGKNQKIPFNHNCTHPNRLVLPFTLESGSRKTAVGFGQDAALENRAPALQPSTKLLSRTSLRNYLADNFTLHFPSLSIA
jgi:hypothetical protein